MRTHKTKINGSNQKYFIRFKLTINSTYQQHTLFNNNFIDRYEMRQK